MRFGLKDEELDAVRGVLVRYPSIRRAEIFGSRALGEGGGRTASTRTWPRIMTG
jgi:hypothetical protein